MFCPLNPASGTAARPPWACSVRASTGIWLRALYGKGKSNRQRNKTHRRSQRFQFDTRG